MTIAKSGGLSGGSAVIDAGSGVLLDAGRWVLAIRHAGGGEQSTRDNLAAVTERKGFVAAVDGDACDLKRGKELGTKPLRLSNSAARKLAAANAGWKSQIVFNAGARSGLSAGSVSVEQERAQTFRRAIDSSGKSGGTGADDREIVDVEGRDKRLAETLGNIARGGIAQDGRAIIKEQRGKLVVADSGCVKQHAGIGVARDIEPAIRNEIAGEVILDGVRLRRPLEADEAKALGFW